MVKPFLETIKAQVDFYLDPVTPLLQAWYIAEGGRPSTFIKAIQCSIPSCVTLEEALARGAKTIRSRMIAYCEFCTPGGQPLFVLVQRQERDPWTGEDGPRRIRFSDHFIEFLGARVAPLGAKNDPKNLNVNWIDNVKYHYAKLLVPPAPAGSVA